MRIIILIFISSFFLTLTVAQIDIQISIGNTYADTAIIGQYLGKRFTKITTINKTNQNVFQLKNINLEPGIYALIYKRDNLSTEEKKINFLIDEKNQKFEIKVNNFLQNNATFIGSNDNILLKGYQKSMDSIFTLYRKTKDEWIAKEDQNSFQSVANLEQLIGNENKKLFINSESQFLKSILSNYMIEFPVYTGSHESQNKQRQEFYSNSFLNKIRLESKSYQLIEQGIDFFDLYSIFSSDGDNKVTSERSITLLNRLMKENKVLGNYYLNYLFNSFPRMTAHGYDGVTIDLVNNFLSESETYDLPAEKIERMKSTAAKLKTLLPGEPMPQLTLLNEDKTPLTIQSIKSKYTILVVWSPDCGHCKKELPLLKEKFEKYKSKGLTVATICSKRGAGLAECSNYMNSQNMPQEWLKLNDNNGASGYISKLDATSYPAFYLLDENKNFIIKRKGELTDAEFEKIFRNL